MGVQGLWRLIEPSGKPVPLETLENKILAVDISIWLHQAIKGFQDSKGAPLPNAHLLGIYHRVCKLLYFRVKPVFVFDGGVPLLKKQTIANRQEQKNKNLKEANDIQSKLLKTLLKHSAISKVIGDKNALPEPIQPENTNSKDNMFILPELPAKELDSTLDSYSSSSDESSSNTSPIKQWDLHTIDEKSEHFKSLPADVRHEILTDIIETRKQSSWGRLHELPTESNDFSSFQMKRLLKRFSVQTELEETIKEMGGHSLSLGELEKLLNADGIETDPTGRRIASDENTRYLLIKDVQKAIQKAKDDEEKKKLLQETLNVIEEEEEPTETTEIKTTNTNTNKEFEDELAAAIQLSLQEHQPPSPKKIEPEIKKIETIPPKNDEFDKDLAAAIQLSLQDQPSTSKEEVTNEFDLSLNKEEDDSDSDTTEVTKITRLQQAKSYMMEYSGLTPNEIEKIINSNKPKPPLNKKQKSIKNVAIKETSKLTTISDKSESESEDSFIEVPNTSSSNKPVEIMSDSDDSDFVEVNTSEPIIEKNNCTNPALQIVIDPNNKEIKDDIFSDIFTDKNVIKNKIETVSLEVVINTNKKVDDLFSDIFVENKAQTEITVDTENTEPTQTDIKISKNEKEIEKIKELKDDLATKQQELPQTNKNEKAIAIEKPLLSVEELNKMKDNLATEQQELIMQRNTKERIANNITDQMYQEAQELLELFGLPYIVAPMEAEAQCAFLNEIDLTHGTITDDSDIWLFGGKTVYKNFFNHDKHVLEFRAESIEHHFKLTREQLILLALLVGSDYTVGIQGIGPVTALEILAAFPPSRTAANISVLTQAELTSGLREFKKWLNNSKAIGVARTSLRNKLKNVNIKESFPSLQVVQAYLQPEVETCADTFSWSKPDIVGLIDFAKEKFGWTKLKSEEILKPVIKRMEDKNIQKTIKDYFASQYKHTAEITDEKLSKRVKTAIKRLGNKDEGDNNETNETKPKKTRKTKKTKEAAEPNADNAENNETNKETKIKRRKNTKKDEATSSNTDTVNTVEDEAITTNITKKSEKEIVNINNRFSPHPASIEAKRRVRAAKKEQLHAKQTIPQRERDKKDALRNKLKAIEAFRKSKAGPGFIKKRPKIVTPLKEDAELSESSSD